MSDQLSLPLPPTAQPDLPMLHLHQAIADIGDAQVRLSTIMQQGRRADEGAKRGAAICLRAAAHRIEFGSLEGFDPAAVTVGGVS